MGFGGVIQDRNGNLILSYSGPAGVCSVNIVEVVALLTGLREAFGLNLYGILVECSS